MRPRARHRHYRSRCSGNNFAILAAAHGAGGLEPGPTVGEFTMVAVSHWLATKQERMGGVACVASEASNPEKGGVFPLVCLISIPQSMLRRTVTHLNKNVAFAN